MTWWEAGPGLCGAGAGEGRRAGSKRQGDPGGGEEDLSCPLAVGTESGCCWGRTNRPRLGVRQEGQEQAEGIPRGSLRVVHSARQSVGQELGPRDWVLHLVGAGGACHGHPLGRGIVGSSGAPAEGWGDRAVEGHWGLWGSGCFTTWL